MAGENTQQGSVAAQAFRGWQEGVAALLGGYNRQAGPGIWGVQLDPTQVRESVQRIADETREVTYAQVAVVNEWLRVPFWFTGTVSPSSLQTSYGRLFQAYNRLFTAYVEAARPARQAAERAVEATANAVEQQVQSGRAVAREVTKSTAAAASSTIDTVAKGAAETNRAAVSAVDQAIEVVEQAANRTEADAATGHVVKGKIARNGEKIYHVFGQANYDRFTADMEFASEEAARAAGFRPAQR